MMNGQVSGYRAALLSWYDREKRDLPWRRTRDPYRIWVSEVMLQQTQVATVIGYYNRFLDTFPDVAALAAAPVDAVLKRWQGLGYYNRGRNLHAAAVQVAADHRGRVPSDPAVFRSLPGVGAYICAAVQSIAFEQPLAVVDGNVKRVLARLFKQDAPVNHTGSMKVFTALAGPLLSESRPGDYNQAVMELGALVCRPAVPACGWCPVQVFCRAYADGEVAEYPKRNPTRKIPEVRQVCGAWCRDDAILLIRRPETGLLAGLWELPGEGVKPDESAKAALMRFFNTRFGRTLKASDLGYLGEIQHTYTHFRLRLSVFSVAGVPDVSTDENTRWVSPEEMRDVAVHRAAEKALDLVRETDVLP